MSRETAIERELEARLERTRSLQAQDQELHLLRLRVEDQGTTITEILARLCNNSYNLKYSRFSEAVQSYGALVFIGTLKVLPGFVDEKVKHVFAKTEMVLHPNPSVKNELQELADKILMEDIPLDNKFHTDTESSDDENNFENYKEFGSNIPPDSEQVTNNGNIKSNDSADKENVSPVILQNILLMPAQNMINPEALVEDICFQSNLYAVQKNKRLDLTEKELLAFIGINFFMAYHQLPNWKHYWNGSSDSGIPLVSNAMARTRFEQVLSNLHCNDNTQLPKR
ncbi:hypothetical protein NQ317_019596 [Molorchus minor]|uniref:PiggyBac transposable element-derived protein domain-containing protein n=1 Tax=Molorchus minor TaxID=1323400 RepID=A0ABQ9J601_9CUCU|nr:hypothetical protein NQ317_019596 [Molorchus minor]